MKYEIDNAVNMYGLICPHRINNHFVLTLTPRIIPEQTAFTILTDPDGEQAGDQECLCMHH